jgi:hypothetical protein
VATLSLARPSRSTQKLDEFAAVRRKQQLKKRKVGGGGDSSGTRAEPAV